MEIIRTRLFDRRAREVHLDETRIRALLARLAEHPDLGDLIRGGGGARKIRISLPGRGTRGGGRVIYAIVWRGSALALLTVYTKSEQSDLSPAERRQIAALVRAIDEEKDNG
jgi:hypothetical protein